MLSCTLTMLRGAAVHKRLLHALPPTISTVVQTTPNAAVGSAVTVQGHIRAVKFWKTHGFVDVSDGSTALPLNIVVGAELADKSLKVGQSIRLVGEVAQLKVKANIKEIVCSPSTNETHEFQIVGTVPENYPIQKKKTSMEFLRGFPTLRHRTATIASVFRFRLYLEGAFGDFFRSEQCVKVSPPVITASDCEGAGELFSVRQEAMGADAEFFDSRAFLTVSTQLHLEVLAPSLNRVWTLTPCFRAENSDTNRHLSEFWMLEVELSYIDDVAQLTRFSQRMIQHVANKTAPDGFDDLVASYRDPHKKVLMQKRWDSLQGATWPSITYEAALDILNTHKKGEKLAWGATITTDHEKWLAGTHFEGPVFITDYPVDQKPFYMKRSKDFNPAKPTVACYDLIVPEVGELIGGSLRIHDHAELMDQLTARGMNKEALQWYISLRENGTTPHGGFGMGFERLTMYLAAQDNIRDVIPFPRYPSHIKC